MSILERVQHLSPDSSSYLEDLVDRAKSFVVAFCRLPAYPESRYGYCLGGEDALEALTGLSTATFFVAVNGSGFRPASILLADCTGGEATANALQTAIRSVSTEFGFDEVAVSFDSSSSRYLAQSGRIGTASEVYFGFEESAKHVAMATRLAREFGAYTEKGGSLNPALEDATVALVETMYRKLGLEGLQSGSIPGGVSFNAHDIDPWILSILLANRKL